MDIAMLVTKHRTVAHGADEGPVNEEAQDIGAATVFSVDACVLNLEAIDIITILLIHFIVPALQEEHIVVIVERRI